MVTLAPVVLVRADDEGLKALDGARDNAQADPYIGGLQPDPLVTHMPGVVEYDVEASWVKTDAGLRFVQVRVNGHPVGQIADATTHAPSQQHVAKFARSEGAEHRFCDHSAFLGYRNAILLLRGRYFLTVPACSGAPDCASLSTVSSPAGPRIEVPEALVSWHRKFFGENGRAWIDGGSDGQDFPDGRVAIQFDTTRRSALRSQREDRPPAAFRCLPRAFAHHATSDKTRSNG